MSITLQAIRDNYQRISERISKAAINIGRNPNDIKIVAVSKGQPREKIRNAVVAGINVFGENYVQEGVEKISLFTEYPDIEWHMVGHVQSRKARQVAEHFSWVHSIDRLKLAVRLDRICKEINIVLPVLLEFNVSGEGSKFGIPAWEGESWQTIAEVVDQILALENLQLRGLMTMPPLFEDPENARPFFVRLRGLGEYLRDRIPTFTGDDLSMGMSADYEIAVEEGATMVRIGTAIFGPRENK